MRLVGDRKVFSVEEITARLSTMFEGLRSFWVEAEVQDLRPAGGQMRFTLRGEHVIDASMNGVLFERLENRPGNGVLVQAYGRVEFWRARGQVSMRVERLELAGEGLLRARVEELRARLDAEGLLAAERKRRPPMLPRRVGLVTSADGAARDDVLTTLWARFPADVVLVGVPVQGDAAPALVARAIAHLDAIPDVDVIVVTRGGGSLEDLMAFNSETVCRAVAQASTPIVSAVGHERDVTLCDLVADVRVATPTAVAEAIVPSAAALDTHLGDAALAIGRGLGRARAEAEAALTRRAGALARALRAPEAIGRDRVERLAPRLAAALRRSAVGGPERLAEREAALARSTEARRAAAAAGVARAEGLLGLLSPRRTVARGYAIVRDATDARVIASASGIGAGRELVIELRDGSVAARATEPAR